jgi:hypothetical protein
MTALNEPYTIYNNYISPNKNTLMTFLVEAFYDSKSATRVKKAENVSIKNLKEIDKIKSFLNLEPNWDSYDAIKTDAKVIWEAVDFVKKIDKYSIDVYFSAPGPNGEISIELKNQIKTIEFIFYPESRWKFVSFEGDKLDKQGAFQLNNLDSLISWLKK